MDDNKKQKLNQLRQKLSNIESRRQQIMQDITQLESNSIISYRTNNLIVFRGGMGKKQLAIAHEKLDNISEKKSNLILATGRYLGEGFDNSRLDTLFLALPVSWKGTIAQYAGWLHRDHHSKSEVVIYDYADMNVPMLATMFKRRLKGYKLIGYESTEFVENHREL